MFILTKDSRVRVTLRMDDNFYNMVKYWANKENMSVNNFLLYCIETTMDLKNGNYHIPDLLITRLTQLIESNYILTENFQQLEDVCNQGFKSLIDLTRGANYLMDDGDDLKEE